MKQPSEPTPANSPSPRQQVQDYVDSLIAEASDELKAAPADLARVLTELSAITTDYALQSKPLDDKTAKWLRRSIDTAIATASVRNAGRVDRSQRAALNLASALLIGSITKGVDLAALSH